MEKIFAIIIDGKVENVIVAKQEFIENLQQETVDVTKMENRPGPGWSYDGEKFNEPIRVNPAQIPTEKKAKLDAIKHLSEVDEIPIDGPELKELLKKLIEAIL